MNILVKKICIKDVLLNTTNFYIENKNNDKISALIPNYTIPLVNKVELYLIVKISVYSVEPFSELKNYVSINELVHSDEPKVGQHNIIISDILCQLVNKSSSNDRNDFFDVTNNNCILDNKPLSHVMSLINKCDVDNFVDKIIKQWNISFNKNYKSFKLPKDDLLCNFLVLQKESLTLTENKNGIGTYVDVYIATPFNQSQFINIDI